MSGVSIPRMPSRMGPYRLIEPIGEGATSLVFRAEREPDGTPAAVKILVWNEGVDPTVAARFRREAAIAARLDHPNIVRVLDSGVEETLLWIAMELVDGPTAHEVLQREGPLAPLRVLEIARDVTRALSGAAAKGIIHRDVKPQNIVVTAGGTAKLADLGLARDVTSRSSLTGRGMTVGTPPFMAPEVARADEDIDPRADIYSLGITMFVLLTGEIPLLGGTPQLTMIRHLGEDVPPPSSQAAGVSRQVDDLVRDMTAREREQRLAPDAALERLERLAGR